MINWENQSVLKYWQLHVTKREYQRGMKPSGYFIFWVLQVCFAKAAVAMNLSQIPVAKLHRACWCWCCAIPQMRVGGGNGQGRVYSVKFESPAGSKAWVEPESNKGKREQRAPVLGTGVSTKFQQVLVLADSAGSGRQGTSTVSKE